MAAIDMKKTLRELYAPKRNAACVVQAPEAKYLMADGEGDPDTAPAFREAVEMLYGLSYAMKFALKKMGKNYTVMPLEGLFRADDPSAFIDGRKNEWKWTMMIMQPPEIGLGELKAAEAELAEKRRLILPLPVRLEPFSEGLCVQVLHIGPYRDEGPTIAGLHGFMRERGYGFRGMHHEIYLSDPKRTKPESMRTIIRQPVRETGAQ